MLKLNFILFITFISILQCSITKAKVQKPKNIYIEIDSSGVRDVENDLNELKKILCGEESSKGACPKNKILKDMPTFDDRFDTMPRKCHKKDLPKDCASATECVQRSGIYKIQVEKLSSEPFRVACDAKTDGGDWLVIQRRHDGSVDFYRNWTDYENGFGDIDGEFFIGLKNLHALTNNNGPQELFIIMEDSLKTRVTAKYDSFSIGNETESYKLKSLGEYSGTAGDALRHHLDMKFSTRDRDNDLNPLTNCAVDATGGWWYNNCHHSNLNGKYGDVLFGKGINWDLFRGYTTSLPYVKMMIRRARNV